VPFIKGRKATRAGYRPEPAKVVQCDTCDGQGKVRSMRRGEAVVKFCKDCKGSGYRHEN
jgi:DnaJ-class molecular chaperone